MQRETSNSETSLTIGNYTLYPQQILGQGATGTVYRGIHNQTLARVAIKDINRLTLNDEASRSLLQNQKDGLRKVKSQYVVRLIQILELNNHCYIITDLFEGKTLKDYIRNKGKLPQTDAMAIFRKILTGCNAITQACIIHRDLKPSNILINQQQQPLIIDFGFCSIICAQKVIKAFNVGTPSYMSPQAFLKTLYSEKSDSWALGMLLYEMLYGKTMDAGNNIRQFYEQLRNDGNYVRKQLPANCNSQIREIIERSLCYSTLERLSITNMKYLTDVYHGPNSNNSINTPNTPVTVNTRNTPKTTNIPNHPNTPTNRGLLLMKKTHSLYEPQKVVDPNHKVNSTNQSLKQDEPKSSLPFTLMKPLSTDRNRPMINFGSSSQQLLDCSSPLMTSMSERSHLIPSFQSNTDSPTKTSHLGQRPILNGQQPYHLKQLYPGLRKPIETRGEQPLQDQKQFKVVTSRMQSYAADKALSCRDLHAPPLVKQRSDFPLGRPAFSHMSVKYLESPTYQRER